MQIRRIYSYNRNNILDIIEIIEIWDNSIHVDFNDA